MANDRRDWSVDRGARPPGLMRMVILAVFAGLALAYQIVFLSDKIR